VRNEPHARLSSEKAFSGAICSESLAASVAETAGPALGELIVATARDSAAVLQFLYLTTVRIQFRS
jgi:hypothetical protein